MEFREIMKDFSAHVEFRTDVPQIYFYVASIFINLLCNARSESLSLNRRADRLIQIQGDKQRYKRQADRQGVRMGDGLTDQLAGWETGS